MKQIVSFFYTLSLASTLYSMNSQPEKNVVRLNDFLNKKYVSAFYAIIASNTLIACGDANGNITLWNNKNQYLKTLSGHMGQVSALSLFSKEKSTYLASGDIFGHIKIWDLTGEKTENWNNVFTDAKAHSTHIHSLFFSYTNNTLVSSSSTKINTWLFDFKSPQNTKNNFSMTPKIPTTSSILNPQNDTTSLFYGLCWQQPIATFNLKTKKWKYASFQTKNYFYTLGISPDGQLLGAGTDAGYVYIWDLKTNNCKKIIKVHEGAIYGIILTQNKEHIITCSADATVKIYNINKSRCIHEFKDCKDQIFSVTLTPNEEYIIYCSQDNQIIKRKNPLKK